MLLYRITDHVFLNRGALNAVIVRKNSKSLVINCHSEFDRENCGYLNIKEIICLNYRSSLNSGIVRFADGGVNITVPLKQKGYFTNPIGFLSDPENQFDFYGVHPDNDMISKNIADVITADGGSVIDFEGVAIEFCGTDGDTDGELSCIINDGGVKIGVCGDIIYSGGKLPFLFRFCKGSNGILDYHSFINNKDALIESVKKLSACGMIIPPRGPVITAPPQDIEKLIKNINALYVNYASSSALNFYFPGYLRPAYTIPPAAVEKKPDNFKHFDTSVLVISKNKRGFLIDCGGERAVNAIEGYLGRGEIISLDGCFVTHYHDDHTQGLKLLQSRFGCKIYAVRSMADILENPGAYYLTCLTPNAVKPCAVDGMHEFDWEEYKITIMEFPGQTLYHGALLLDMPDAQGGGRTKILFCGDSFSPTGFDDYCAQNRLFLAGRRGYKKCLDLIAYHKPDYLINQHQENMFVFGDQMLERLNRALDEKTELIRICTPWKAPDFALDFEWVRFYPYVSEAIKGEPHDMELHITGHCESATELRIKLSVPDGVVRDGISDSGITAAVNGYTCGYVNGGADSDIRIPFRLHITENFKGNAAVIGAHVWADGVYHGELCRAVIKI